MEVSEADIDSKTSQLRDLTGLTPARIRAGIVTLKKARLLVAMRHRPAWEGTPAVTVFTFSGLEPWHVSRLAESPAGVSR